MTLRSLTMTKLDYVVHGHKLLNNVSLSSVASACTALLGANGAGKTTLLRLCHGLIEPSRGDIRWGNTKPQNLGRCIAMIFQKPCLLRRSARENIDYALRLCRIPREERRQRIHDVFKLVNLGHRAEHKAHLLSGGEQQRLSIARACALNPEIILMDEPTSKLDIESAVMVEDIIHSLEEKSVRVIFTSHNLSQVRRLCDDVIFLDKGSLVIHATSSDFFNQVKDERICDFIRLQSSF